MNWKSVEYMYERRVACIAHKLYYGKGTDTMKDLIEHLKPGSTNLRDNVKVALNRPRTAYGRNSFKHRGRIMEQTTCSSEKH